jgi:hypothetical protein
MIRILDLDRALEELSEGMTTETTLRPFVPRRATSTQFPPETTEITQSPFVPQTSNRCAGPLCGTRTGEVMARADTDLQVVRIVHSKRHETRARRR